MSETKKKFKVRSSQGYALVDWRGIPARGYIYSCNALENHRPIVMVRTCDYRKLLAFAKKGGMV